MAARADYLSSFAENARPDADSRARCTTRARLLHPGVAAGTLVVPNTPRMLWLADVLALL